VLSTLDCSELPHYRWEIPNADRSPQDRMQCSFVTVYGYEPLDRFPLDRQRTMTLFRNSSG
jgi:hypothetical protein